MTLVPVLVIARNAYPALQVWIVASRAESVEHRTDRAFYSGGVVAIQAIEQAARDQSGNVCFRNLDLVHTKAALAPFAKTRHPHGTGPRTAAPLVFSSGRLNTAGLLFFLFHGGSSSQN